MTSLTCSSLFHATNWAKEILQDEAIRGHPIRMYDCVPGGRSHIGMIGVCTTRSQEFAKLYAPVVFALDRDRIKEKYRSILRAEEAYDSAYYAEYRMEAEEFIPCEKLGLDRYCTGIWLDQTWNDPAAKIVEENPLFKGFFKGHHG
jgi:hypothetical protein